MTTKDSRQRIYWDACVFIHKLQGTTRDSIGTVIDSIITAAKTGSIAICTSELTIAEVCKIKGSPDSASDQSRQIFDFFENDYIIWSQIDRYIAEHAHEIVRDHGLKPADAIHAASAIRLNAKVLMTYDDCKASSLLKRDGQIGSPPLAIMRPYRLDPQIGLLEQLDEAEANTSAVDTIPAILADDQGLDGSSQERAREPAEAEAKAGPEVKE